jgi:ATP-dependent DNA helicase RecG
MILGASDDSPMTSVCSGPLSSMLDAAMDWARRAIPVEQRQSHDGHLRNVPVIPLVAFREIISNALVHRDLCDWATGTPAEARFYHDRLIVMNPGGLHGISVDRLGYERTTSSRNARLVAIAQHVTSPDTGGRVIEALSTGLAVVRDELQRADLPAPVFVDNAIRFTAIVRRSALVPSPPSAGRSRVEQAV